MPFIKQSFDSVNNKIPLIVLNYIVRFKQYKNYHSMQDWKLFQLTICLLLSVLL